jgi:hypothetical protein
MGLDMYLSARRYTSEFSDPEINKDLTPLADKLLPPDGNMGSVTIVRDVAYWRKANAIHKWFVDNVQEGQDDCGTYFVNRGDLEDLRGTCLKVIADPTQAKELLPIQEGFFFGGTDYDDDYIEKLEDTVQQIDKIIAWLELTNSSSSVEFQYHSSW